jgi:hypothetical protein
MREGGKKKKNNCIGQKKKKEQKSNVGGPKVETKKTTKNRIKVEVRRMKK